jgi:hypothetical protein
LPIIFEDVASEGDFVRRETAGQFTIRRAVGIPCSARGPGDWVMTILSVRNAPIAQRFECWVPDEAAGSFKFVDGYCETDSELATTCVAAIVPLDEGLFAELRKTGIPAICPDLGKIDGPVAKSASEAGLTSMIAMPIFVQGNFKAVLAWYL